MILNTTAHRSPNHNPRGKHPINMIILHSCEGRTVNPVTKKPMRPRDSSLPWLCKAASGVSSHYYVCRPESNGDVFVYQLVDDSEVAWHAGITLWNGERNLNDVSIGIECEHRSGQDWPAAQLQALKDLIVMLRSRHPIPVSRILTHRAVAVDKLDRIGRKADPTNWSELQVAQWIKTLPDGTPPPIKLPEIVPIPLPESGQELRRYRVFVRDGVNVRSSASPLVSVIDKLAYQTEIIGFETRGVAYQNDVIWIARVSTVGRDDPQSSGGYIWRRLLEQLK